MDVQTNVLVLCSLQMLRQLTPPTPHHTAPVNDNLKLQISSCSHSHHPPIQTYSHHIAGHLIQSIHSLKSHSLNNTYFKFSTMSFDFPREYHFPAFFTRQTNLTTHHAQLTKWASLVLSYAKHHRLFRLTLSSAADSELFHNRTINRRLQAPDIRELFGFMVKEKQAEFVAGEQPSSSGVAQGELGGVVLLYWRTVDEWAGIVEHYVDSTAQKGSVLTLYEITDGDATLGTGRHTQP